MLAANYLGIHAPLGLTCAKVAFALMRKTPEEAEAELQWIDIDEQTNIMHLYSRNQAMSAPWGLAPPRIGDLVRIYGLQNQNVSDFNNMLGQVSAFFLDRDRYGVDVYAESPTQKSIRTQNLRVVPINTATMTKRALAWYVFWFAETRL